MLGIRLSPDAEERLARHAKALGRGKSVIAREWILERLERESIDAEMRRVSEYLATVGDPPPFDPDAMMDEWLRALDAEDGGYDWGPSGPPA